MLAYPKTVHQAQAWPKKMTHQGSAVHVETVVLVSREKVNGYIDIDLDIEKLIKTKQRW